jgi:hypothetical protein
MSKRLLVILALICAALPVATALSQSHHRASAAVSHRFITGIADQHDIMFSDPRFLNLKITHTRIFMAWDVLTDASQRLAADNYMKAANKLGIDVLVTFTQSRREGRHSIMPTPAQLVSSLKAMRKRWPFLHEFSTFNEVNLLRKKPSTVAKQWLALVKACPTCTILGADLVDRAPQNNKTAADPTEVTNDITTWVAGFLKTTKGKQPKVWGLHNYVDANLKRTSGTKAMLKAVKGDIWFTETGGLVSRSNGSVFFIA